MTALRTASHQILKDYHFERGEESAFAPCDLRLARYLALTGCGLRAARSL